jgi:hypothetical protein
VIRLAPDDLPDVFQHASPIRVVGHVRRILAVLLQRRTAGIVELLVQMGILEVFLDFEPETDVSGGTVPPLWTPTMGFGDALAVLGPGGGGGGT